MVTSVKKTNQINHVSFMPHVFNQSECPFGQCEHFSQVEHFEKPWFLIVLLEALCFNLKSIPLDFKKNLHSINCFLFHYMFTGCSKWNHSCLNGFVTLAPKMSRRMDKFTYLHVKPLFFVQMWMKQPLSHIIISASIDLTHQPKHVLEEVD